MSAFGDHNDAEARRLREGRQRALARDAYEAESLKCKREADERKDQQARRKAQVAAQAAGKEEARLQKAREQCRRERRVDCDRAGIAAAGGQTATRVVVR